MKKLAIITTHPIQYYAPWFRELASMRGIGLKVFYTWSQTAAGPKFDEDFARTINWDIPLLDGYEYVFVENVARDPGIHHFNGINNPLLLTLIDDWQPDALMVIGWNFKSHLRAMRYFKGRIPVLFRGDSTLIDERPGIKKLTRRIFLRWVYTHIDYALYVGKNNFAYFNAHGVQADKLWFVPHAVDNKRFSEPRQEYELEALKWRQTLGISTTDIVLLFAGKLEPKKDPFFMLDLAREISAQRAKFVIIGNGILEQELKKRASGDARIIFLEFQNQQNMPVVYRLGDIFILPSRGPGETWGMSVNEAMACRRPVLASGKVGCVPDLVEDGVTGWVFDAAKQNGPVRISRLLNDAEDLPTRLQTMGQQAFQRVQQYSYQVATANLLGLLDKVCVSRHKSGASPGLNN